MSSEYDFVAVLYFLSYALFCASSYEAHTHTHTHTLPESGCVVVAIVGLVVDMVVDVSITTELTSALQTVLLAVCSVVDTAWR